MVNTEFSESVWAYPRPPALKKELRPIKVEFSGEIIAKSINCYRVLETSHPPSFYIPLADVASSFLVKSDSDSFCEWKGVAKYWHVKVGEKVALNAAWAYENPNSPFLPIKAYFSFYANAVDSCWVGDERVSAQDSSFYGGWVTSEIVGPFKGGPGTNSW